MKEITLQLIRLLEPLEEAADSFDGLSNLLRKLGWILEAEESDWTAIRGKFEFIATIDELMQEIDDFRNAQTDEQELNAIEQILQLVPSLFTNLGDSNNQTQNLAPLNNTEFWSSLGEDLFGFLIYNYFEHYHPFLSGLLELLGIITVSQEEADVLFLRRRINLDRIPLLFYDIPGLLTTEYNWGENPIGDNFKAILLLSRLNRLAREIGADVHTGAVSEEFADKYYTIDSSYRNPVPGLGVNLNPIPNGSNGTEGVWIIAAPIPPANQMGDAPEGIVLFPVVEGITNTQFKLSEFISLVLHGQFESTGALRLEIRPSGITVSPDQNLGSSVGAGITLRYNSELPTVVFGSVNSSNFQVGSWEIHVNVNGQIDSPEIVATLRIEGVKLVIAGGEGDGFLQKLIPPGGIESNFEFAILWSTTEGLRFQGSGALEYTLPMHISLGGIIEIESIHASLGFDENGILGKVGLTTNVELGPIAASIERMGLQNRLTFPGSGGNLGKANIDIGFLPPTGVGLGVSAGPVIGGGYLEIDTENARYAGILGLKAAEIGLTAIGLITTRMPDGSDGFSMLVSIGVVFTPPIQLPYGFVLQGVGGLMGINRDMSTEALQAGLRAKALDSILFPDPATVVENASKIISDLRAVFPPAEGRFVVGPMVKIGWGAGKISAEIGIFISLPMPISIALLGQISAFFPKAGAEAVVELNMDILGILDLGRNMLTFQASLRDSNLLKTYTLYGDSAFLLSWGASPQFALSMGGFHPKFDPPPPPIVFSGLKRLGISMSAGSDFSMVCESYQALTPNTLQFGAMIDLYAKKSGAVFRGHATFDTLIYFSPFSLEAAIAAFVGVEFKGQELADVRLSFVLTGPTPWRARGKATIKILFFEGEKSFAFSWGPDKQLTLEAVDPWEEVTKALDQGDAWGSSLPVGLQTLENLVSDLQSSGTDLIVHPAGRLEVRQQVAPLKIQLAKIGNAPVKDHNRISIDKFEAGYLDENDQFVPATGSGGTLAHEDAFEYFARAQFESLSDSQKLSAPSFEKMASGAITTGTGAIRTDGQDERKLLEFESILLPPLADEDRPKGKMAFECEGRWLCSGTVRARQWASGTPMAVRRITDERRIEVVEDTYVIVNKDDMKAVEGIAQPDAGWTRAEAEYALGVLDPSRREAVIVVTTHEAESTP